MQDRFNISQKIIAHVNRHARLLGIFVLLLILLASPATAAPSVAPMGTCSGTGTLICIDPATQTIGQLQTTTVDIRIDNVTDLYGADVLLTYDRRALCASDASHTCPNTTSVQLTPGPLLTSGGPSQYFVLFNYADNSNGTIAFTITQFNPALPVTGSGVLATITFMGLPGRPQSQIHFTYAKLSVRNGVEIPATLGDGLINIGLPTAVTLSSISTEVSRANGHAIALTWTTASELKTAGFNVYRGEQFEGPYRRINSLLIPASGDVVTGDTYRYTDADVEPGKTYFYQLEDVERNGTTTRHNAIAATAPIPSFWNMTNTGILLLSIILSLAGVDRFRRAKRRK